MFDQWPARGPIPRAWNHTGAVVHARGAAKPVTQEDEDLETRVLLELLDVFPGFSLKDIAQAYTEADSDVNAAAELLSTRESVVRSNGVQEGWKNSTAERKINRYRRQSVEQQPVVKPDDLLLEKYGRGVGELINQRQSNSLSHNVQQSTHDGVPHEPFHLNSRTAHGVSGDNRSYREEAVNKEAVNKEASDGGLLVGRKKTKQKGWGGLYNEGEVADAIVSRQAEEDFLLSMLGENSELGVGVVRDVLDSFKGDLQKSLEVILRMASSTSSLSHNVDSTTNRDGCYFDDKKLDYRIQQTDSHVDKARMQTSIEHQKYHEGFWNEHNLVPKAVGISNGYSHQRSTKDKTDHDQYKVSLKELKECFPQVHDSYLFNVLQSTNFVLSDAVQFLLDATANKQVASSPAEANVGLGNRSNTFKSNVLKENVTARPPPLKAAWADVKRTVTPLKQNWTDVSSEGKNGLAQFKSCGDMDDYGRHRLDAEQHWRMMDYYFKEAAAAFERGERCRAATLAEKGKEYKQLAQEADGRASERIFQSRNKDIVNNITIDLHAQHVNEAINVLRRHLQTLCSIPSVHMLTVITGYGSHSMNGRAKVKPAVTDFLSKSKIPWETLNEGCLTIKLIDVCNKDLDMSDGE